MLYRRHRAGVKRVRNYKEVKGLKLNIGCGRNRKDGWLNIDIFHPAADLSLDMREEIPLSSGSSKIIYAEDFLDCLEYPDETPRFLRECFRLLEAGGILRLGVADTRWPMLDYASVGDGRYFAACETERWHARWCRTRMDHINYHFRGPRRGRIYYRYDLETIQHVLDQAGFVEIRQCDHDPNIDAERHALGILYVTAVRPD